jgi:Protein of unknown function (DUF3040)
VGLSARQERALEDIESALRASDPKLAALYTTFTRLASGEEMPRVEQLRYRAGRMLGGLRRFACVVLATVLLRRKPHQRSAVLFFPLALTVVAMSFVSVRPSSSPGCTGVKSVAAAKNPARSRLCPPNRLSYQH